MIDSGVNSGVNSGVDSGSHSGSGIFLGIGANLVADGFSSPQAGCVAALASLKDEGVEVVAISSWYESAPVPLSDQPWYHNGVAEVATEHAPEVLMSILHKVEAGFGRVRVVRNEARVLDIDIIDYRGLVLEGGLTVPHPRMHERAFVLRPLSEIAPSWRHPITGESVGALLEGLGSSEECRRLEV